MKSFDEALADAEAYSKKHVLLGNGFSIAARPNVFQYGALFDRADFSRLSSKAREVFDILSTRDFEEVIRTLVAASHVVNHYADEHDWLVQTLSSDATALREVLVAAIADSHPESPADMRSSELDSARQFLSHFASVYSCNYDLLLYWTIMRDIELAEGVWDDGFRKPSEDPEAEYLAWEIERTDQQNIHYMHGALQIFDAGSEVQKYSWINTGVRLIEQVRDALSREKYPLIVAEGSAEKKLETINHSNYLSRCYRSFARIGGCVFAFGFSMAENDRHILDLFAHNRVKKLYVGVYGDPESVENKRQIQTANSLSALRSARQNRLDVDFFDAESAQVWTRQLQSSFR